MHGCRDDAPPGENRKYNEASSGRKYPRRSLKFWEPQLQPRSTVACRSGPRTVKNSSLFAAVKTLPVRRIELSCGGHRYRPAASTALPEGASPFTVRGCRPLPGGDRLEFTAARRARTGRYASGKLPLAPRPKLFTGSKLPADAAPTSRWTSCTKKQRQDRAPTPKTRAAFRA